MNVHFARNCAAGSIAKAHDNDNDAGVGAGADVRSDELARRLISGDRAHKHTRSLKRRVFRCSVRFDELELELKLEEGKEHHNHERRKPREISPAR